MTVTKKKISVLKQRKEVRDISKLIKITFKTLCVMGLSFILCGNVVNGQDKKPKVEVITDDNFKKKVAKGFVLIKFTSGDTAWN